MLWIKNKIEKELRVYMHVCVNFNRVDTKGGIGVSKQGRTLRERVPGIGNK